MGFQPDMSGRANVAGGYLLKSSHPQMYRKPKIDTDADAAGGYANKANYLNTAVGALNAEAAAERRKKLGAFQPIYAYMTVDKTHGAGVGFKYSEEGWEIDRINPVPGQPELEIGDVIFEIEGKSIKNKDVASQTALFKQFFKPPKVILKIERNRYAKLHNNVDAVHRQYEIEGRDCKALRDYKNNPKEIKDRFMDDASKFTRSGLMQGGKELDLKHSKLDTVRAIKKRVQKHDALSKQWAKDDSACWRPGN